MENIQILKPMYDEWAQGIYGGENPYDDEFIDLGGDNVIVLGWWRGTSKSSGHVVQRNAAHLWKFGHGKAVKLMLCRDAAEAREFVEGF